MPFYDYKNTEDSITKLFLKSSEAHDVIIIDDLELHRVYSPPAIASGMNALEKKAGTTHIRKEMTEFTKEQRRLRKTEYDPSSREARSNELWTGKEGMDGVTDIAMGDKSKRAIKRKDI